jgi:acyl carrier protein
VKPAEIEAWLCAWIGQRLALPADRIDPTKPFSDFGIDSLTAVELTTSLGAWLKRELPTTLVWDYPNVRNLAANVAAPAVVAAAGPAVEPAKGASPAGGGLADLSEQDLAALLAQELQSMRGPARRA